MFRTILADPPWLYRDKLVMGLTPRGADDNYSTMSVDEICKLWKPDTQRLAGYELKDDAFLFLWVTNPFLLNGAGVTVCEAWGFKPKQLITWVKGRVAERLVLRTGLGHYTRGVTEHMILATRGQPKVFVKDSGVNNLVVAEEDTVILAPPSGHSKKPEASYQLIERVCPGAYLELFARQRRDGWTSWGNQL